ncbi:hypothetical protein B5G50_08215 [Brevibacillus brevis]|uniref:hypothetical protein n=1 Tax=Brevibacillus brevis TaxID=1393 RepID=UPI000B36CE98|nr:hypothetical protein [Brevibacillus brevis]OUQ88886.1 hypothetical protein B5G50_08215 [Brevibacillus brevis]
MKGKIKGSKYNGPILSMWYSDKVGEIFDVQESEFDELFQTKVDVLRNGKLVDCHIYKEDCEIIET